MPSLQDSLQYPTIPAFTPVSAIEDVELFQIEVYNYLRNVAYYEQTNRESLLDVLATETIPQISVDKLLAGTIAVDGIFVGDDIEIDGLLSQIRVSDDTRDRFVAGRFGAGTAAGFKAYKDDGTLLINVSDTIYLDGVIIADNTISADALNVTQLSAITADLGSVTAGTITGALIRTSASNPRVEMTSTGIAGYSSGGVVMFDLTTSGTVRLGPSAGDNILANASGVAITGDIIVDGNIVSMNFGKNTTGTISTSGTINFDGGADINMRAAASGDNNLINFKTSGGSVRGTLGYGVTANIFYLLGTAAGISITTGTNTDLNLTAAGTGDLFLNATSDDIITNAAIVRGQTTGVTDLGSASVRYNTLHLSGGIEGDSNIVFDTTAGGSLVLGGSAATVAIGSALVASADVYPITNDNLNLGKSGSTWGTIWANSTQVHDIVFANKFYLTEAWQVNPKLKEDGIYLMSHERTPLVFFSENGDIYPRGEIKQNDKYFMDLQDTRKVKSKDVIKTRNIKRYSNRKYT